MTYDEYIAQQQQAIDEEQQEDSCFLEYQPKGSLSVDISKFEVSDLI